MDKTKRAIYSPAVKYYCCCVYSQISISVMVTYLPAQLGLVLTTSAVFLTSSPPSPEYIRYDDFVAYVFVYLTFVTATCGVFSGAAVLIAVSGSGTTAEVFREVGYYFVLYSQGIDLADR